MSGRWTPEQLEDAHRLVAARLRGHSGPLYVLGHVCPACLGLLTELPSLDSAQASEWWCANPECSFERLALRPMRRG